MTCTWLPWMEWNWSTIWEALAAAGTLTAVIVTVELGRADRRHREDEMKRLEDERDEERVRRVKLEQAALVEKREAQARRIVVSGQFIAFDDDDNDQFESMWEVTITNYSDMPIFGMRVGVREPLAPLHEMGGELLPTQPRSRTFKHAVPPEASPPGSAPFLRFRDAAGVWWDRLADGRLLEVPTALLTKTYFPGESPVTTDLP